MSRPPTERARPDVVPYLDVALGRDRVLRIGSIEDGRIIHLRTGIMIRGGLQADLAVMGSLVLRRRELPVVVRALAKLVRGRGRGC